MVIYDICFAIIKIAIFGNIKFQPVDISNNEADVIRIGTIHFVKLFHQYFASSLTCFVFIIQSYDNHL